MPVPGKVVGCAAQAGRGFFHFAHDVADDLAVLDDTLKKGGPFHQVAQVEGKVVVFREVVEVAEVELEDVIGCNTPDDGHFEGAQG